MPLARYFIWVGGVLLALLSIVNLCLPKLPVIETDNTRLPPVRIHSNQKWPERVVFDTSLQTIVPAQPANAEAIPESPTPEIVIPSEVRQAFAQALPKRTGQMQRVERTEEKKRHLQRKIAKRRGARPALLAARQPQFGWFGVSFW
jgi:hypothetical protein